MATQADAARIAIPPRAALPSHPALRRGSDLALTGHLLPTGMGPFDAALGGLALRRTHLLTGAYGHGATSLLHILLAAITPDHPVLLFDPHARFHPPAAAAAGVHLPHLPWLRTDDPRHIRLALGFALRGDAFPLIVWDVGVVPPAALLDRLRPLIRRSGSALLLVAMDGLTPGSVADGTTLRVEHGQWSHSAGTRRGCDGRALTVHATDHARGRSLTFPLRIAFPTMLPSLLPFAHIGGRPNARTTRRGALDTGAGAPMRRAG